MPSVWKSMNKRTGKSHPRWKFYFVNYKGKREYGTGTKSRAQTYNYALAMEREHQEIHMGMRPTPAENKVSAPYETVVEEYFEWGRSKGGRGRNPWSPTHERNKFSRLTFWQKALEIDTLGNFLGCLPRTEEILRTLHNEGRSAKTVNDYADALHSFIVWCERRDYLSNNPLKHLERLPDEPTITRRALTLDEIDRLLKVAPPKRRILYLLALITGLRAGELAKLAPKHLDATRQGLSLEKRMTKNRKTAFVPLSRELFKELQIISKIMEPDTPFLKVPTHTARMLDIDLEKANIPKLTDEGKIDFHALRTTFVTLTIESGATPVEAQSLARHSTINLTMNTYARARNERLSEITQTIATTISRSQ